MAFIFGIDLGWMMLLGDMVWMPWTSTRNKIESGLHFILSLKRERVLIMTAETESKRDFLVHLARYGVARRVGTIFSQSGKVAVFQSSAKWAEYSAQQQ